MPSSELDDRYLKLFRPHLAADKLNRNIRSHRHAESRFRHARDERIGDWQNRQRVLFADVQKFLDGTALADTLLEYDNASLPTEDDSSLLWLFSQPFLLHRNQSLRLNLSPLLTQSLH